jgi:hypothetical protein
MRIRHGISTLLFTGFIIFLELTGCVLGGQPNGQPVAPMKFPTETIVSLSGNQIAPTETKSITLVSATSSPIPSATNTQTPKTPFLISTMTATATWRPFSSLSPEEAQTRIHDLVENNGGCRLPCLWGMTPGETDWVTARRFLESFVKNIEKKGEKQIIRDGQSILVTDFEVQYNINDDIEDTIWVTVENGLIANMIVGEQMAQRVFQLHQLLADYGPPDEVYISAYRVASGGGSPPFYFLVYYGRKNFWADFNLDGRVEGNLIKGCPQSIAPFIWLESPNNKWRLEALLDYIFGPAYSGFPRYPILTLNEATGMDLDTFTTIFKDPNNRRCIETPAELWN